MKSLTFLTLAGLLCHAMATSSETSILKTLEVKSTTTVIVTMKNSSHRALTRQTKAKAFPSRADRINYLHDTLKKEADTKQVSVLESLKLRSKLKPAIQVKSLWISNQIIVRNCDLETAQLLLAHENVASIHESRSFPIPEVTVSDPKDAQSVGKMGKIYTQWGVETINAPQAWAKGVNGSGIVVANIDTGVMWTHEALVDNFRGDYGWFDPITGSPVPNDDHGHGTHTMGTICGRQLGIGVAPGATWMACPGCTFTQCNEESLLECGQWIACPTDPQGANEDCSKAPHIVSNSWGLGKGDPWYDDCIDVWEAARILPLFSVGNNYYCNSIKSPSDNAKVIGVGATDAFDKVAYFSSRGPTKDGRIKPDIAAPGVNIFSSNPSSTTAYVTLSGTSMACPHVAGVAALVLSAHPDYNIDDVKNAIFTSATRVNSSTNTCGATIGDGTEAPNNFVGWGRLDVSNL